MKEYTVVLGGTERKLRFNSFDGVALYKRFKRPLQELLWQGVLGYGRDGQIGAGFDPEVQIAVLTAGLVRGGTRCNEDMVTQWFDTHLQAGKASGDLLWPAVKAFFYSGAATGVQVDLEELAEQVGKTTSPVATDSAPATEPAGAVRAADGL
jgi:hypothetical protein